MKKFYTDKSSFVLLYKNFILNAQISIKNNFLFIFFIFIFFPSHLFSQQTIISGAENIYISDDASVIIVDAENSNQEKISFLDAKKIKSEKKSANSEKDRKEKITLNKKKKNHKKVDEKQVKKSYQFITIFNTNLKKEDFFPDNSCACTHGINDLENYKTLDNSILEEELLLTFLYFDQQKENRYFSIDYSKFSKFSLFTRPPPSQWS